MHVSHGDIVYRGETQMILNKYHNFISMNQFDLFPGIALCRRFMHFARTLPNWSIGLCAYVMYINSWHSIWLQVSHLLSHLCASVCVVLLMPAALITSPSLGTCTANRASLIQLKQSRQRLLSVCITYILVVVTAPCCCFRAAAASVAPECNHFSLHIAALGYKCATTTRRQVKSLKNDASKATNAILLPRKGAMFSRLAKDIKHPVSATLASSPSHHLRSGNVFS